MPHERFMIENLSDIEVSCLKICHTFVFEAVSHPPHPKRTVILVSFVLSWGQRQVRLAPTDAQHQLLAHQHTARFWAKRFGLLPPLGEATLVLIKSIKGHATGQVFVVDH